VRSKERGGGKKIHSLPKLEKKKMIQTIQRKPWGEKGGKNVSCLWRVWKGGKIMRKRGLPQSNPRDFVKGGKRGEGGLLKKKKKGGFL